MNEERKRVRATVRSASLDCDHDHCTHVLNVHLDLGGAHQSFQACAPVEALKVLAEDIAALFRVGGLSELEGRSCWALYALGENNEGIEGLECDEGIRVLKSMWWRKLHPDAPSLFGQLWERARGRVAGARRRLEEAEADLAALPGKFTDWELEPIERTVSVTQRLEVAVGALRDIAEQRYQAVRTAETCEYFAAAALTAIEPAGEMD